MVKNLTKGYAVAGLEYRLRIGVNRIFGPYDSHGPCVSFHAARHNTMHDRDTS
jgi:hypothetical protein